MKSLYYRQILFLILLFVAFLIIIGALIMTGPVSAETANAVFENNSFAKKKLVRFDGGNIVISKDEKFDADIVIKNGTLVIEGEILGDVFGLDSDITLGQYCAIYGNVVCYLGDIKKEDDARIAGDLICASSGKDSYLNKTTVRNLEGYKFPYLIFNDQNMDTTHVIEREQNVVGDVIVIEKEMVVYGKIDGNLISLDSKIRVTDSGVIDGHVINYNSVLDIETNALVTGEIFDQTVSDNSDRSARENRDIRDAVEEKFLKRRSSEIIRFFGDVTIEKNEIIDGDVVIMKGTASVKGEVDGDIVSIFGNVDLDSTAYVSGDVVSVGGRIYREKNSHVGGDVVQTTWTGVRVEEDNDHVQTKIAGIKEGPQKVKEWDKRQATKRWCEEDEEMDEFLFRYNRVEGLVLGFQLPRHHWDEASKFNVAVYGQAGYGFKSKKIQYQLGLERWFFDTFRFTVGGEVHDFTDTQDKWIIPTFENSLAAILFREDFHDYYRRVGASAYVMQNITANFRMSVGYCKDKYYDMEKVTNWSVFGGDKKFQENPLIEQGGMEMNSLFAEIGLDTRNSMKYPTQGWYITLKGEFAGSDLNDNGIDFDRFIADVRRYQPLGYGENLDFRLRMGTSRGDLPMQFRYDLGGISTLRGCRFKEYENGDRMILGNVEYRIYGSEGFMKEFEDINLILFVDAGLVWNAENNSSPEKSFKHLTWDDLKTDVGIALSNQDGNVRLSFAQRMDDRNKPAVVTFRIRRPF